MRKLPVGTSHIRYVYRMYRKNAKRRGIQFDISIAEFRQLAVLNCTYCGEPPRMRKWVHQSIPINGIDRVDSSIGYEMKNCVTACSDCNKLKSNKPRDEFMELIGRIYVHQKV